MIIDELKREGTTRIALTCRGRIFGSSGRVNTLVRPGNDVDGAVLDWDKDSKLIRIRINDTAIPEFWLEAEIPKEPIMDLALYEYKKNYTDSVDDHRKSIALYREKLMTLEAEWDTLQAELRKLKKGKREAKLLGKVGAKKSKTHKHDGHPESCECTCAACQEDTEEDKPKSHTVDLRDEPCECVSCRTVLVKVPTAGCSSCDPEAG
jgi:hypothetical protein